MEHFHGSTTPYNRFIEDTGSEPPLHFLRREDMEMQSNHIDNKRLYSVVNEGAILEAAEVDHLSKCEECLEMIRVLVRQNLSRSADAS